MKASLYTITALVLSLASGAMAAGTNEVRGQFNHSDYKFATVASKAGNGEVALSQVALTKATDPGVKAFAQKMVDDHTKAGTQLSQLVAQKGATIPTETTSAENREVAHLQGLSGADFDKAYMKKMVKDHKMVVKEFEFESNHAKDEELKAFAASTLPTLQDHLKMAEDLESKVVSAK